MTVYTLDPLSDTRYSEFIRQAAGASIFHSPAWLEALQRTYGYAPVAYTTSPPGESLKNVIPFCRIDSWLTGRRLVSLPFSDHCEPLVDRPETLEALLAAVKEDAENTGQKYVELRPMKEQPEAELEKSFTKSASFYLHRIDLDQDVEGIYARFHKSCIKRKIKRARREELTCRRGSSDELLDDFYQLLVSTRRKHRIPPQPRSWFRNVLDCLGDNAVLHVASEGGRAVSAILTCSWGGTHYYKYGCSDDKRANLGGMPLLMWRAISIAREQDAVCFDLGRSGMTNSGLVKFKDRLGAGRTTLTYFRAPAPKTLEEDTEDRKTRCAGAIFSRLPDRLLKLSGSLLYRHVG